MNSNPVFTSQQIIETARNSLAARAVLRLGTICELGTVWISDAECIRWNADLGRGEVCLGGSSGRWYAIVDNGVEMLARAEALNWRRDDGTVWHWQENSVSHVTVSPETKKRLMKQFGLTEDDFVTVDGDRYD